MKSPTLLPCYVLVSGGTGGHLFPALSLGEKLKNANNRVCLVTDQRGAHFINQSKFDAKIFDHIYVDVLGGGILGGKGNFFKTNKFFKKLWLYFSLLAKTFTWVWRFRQLKPNVVVGFGGYPSLPPLLAAQLLGIATLIHEQNAKLGRANRLLAKKAKVLATSFKDTSFNDTTAPTGIAIVLTGNPVRPQILNTQIVANDKTTQQSSLKAEQPFKILVIGGSQGAKIFSEVIPPALAGLSVELPKKIAVVQQCRAELLEFTQKIYENQGIYNNQEIPQKSFPNGELSVELMVFINDIGSHYNRADLIISRAGASTLAELAIVKKPVILVPYAASIEGDQMHNALSLQKSGAALVIKESEFTVQLLQSTIRNLIDNPDKLQQLSQNIAILAKPLAADSLADVVKNCK